MYIDWLTAIIALEIKKKKETTVKENSDNSSDVFPKNLQHISIVDSAALPYTVSLQTPIDNRIHCHWVAPSTIKEWIPIYMHMIQRCQYITSIFFFLFL
jgi:hypothetical protein